MKIGIAAATRFEIQPTIDFLQALPLTTDIPGPDIIITGIGSMLSAYELTRYISIQRPQYMIQAGIGGSFSDSYPPGELVCIKQEVMGDLGVQEGNDFRDIFDLGFLKPDEWPFDNGVLINPHPSDGAAGTSAWANGITVNEISTDPSRIQWLKDKYKGDIESMEGAAFHYVCLREQVPFIQLRAVSNHVGERDKSKWLIKQAIENLNIGLINLLQSLS